MKKKEQFVLVRCPVIASNHKVKNKQNLGGSYKPEMHSCSRVIRVFIWVFLRLGLGYCLCLLVEHIWENTV